ncbi:MAG TPA: CHAT domain-containing protein [Candidatus Eisenbacteria bacterium]|nr:CHAT domain-containing protein [Candidatus Eisenbacteria bacterium]
MGAGALAEAPGTPRATTLDDVRGLIRAGRYEEAERAARALLAEAERVYGDESMPVAEILDQLAEAMRNAGHSGAPDALGICERAVRLKEKLAGKSSAPYAASLHNLGALHLTNGDLSLARPPLERALEIRRKALGEDHPDVARSMIFLAKLDADQARLGDAETLVEGAIAIQQKVLPEDDPERMRALNMLASLKYELGDYVTPASMWEHVLSSRRKTLGADHPLVAEALHNLGTLAVETGDLDEAMTYLEGALRIRRDRLGSYNPYVAFTLLALGQVQRSAGDRAGARARLEEALRIQERPENKNQINLAWTLGKLGDLLIELKDYTRARALLTRARRIQERGGEGGHLDLAWTLNSLARIAEHDGNWAEAEALYASSLKIKQTLYGDVSPDVVETESQLARCLLAGRDSARAFPIALGAARARAEHLRSTAGGLSERQALAYAGVGSLPLDLLLAMAPAGSKEQVSAAWDALIRSRTIVLDEIAARHGAVMSGLQDSSITGPRRELDAARQRYANLLVRGIGGRDPGPYRAAIDRARDDVERAERVLAARSGRFRTAMRREVVGWKEVGDALPEGWDLVAYALYGEGAQRSYVAFVGRRGQPPTAVRLGTAAAIDPLIQRFVRACGRSDRGPGGTLDRRAEPACRAAGLALRRRIWDPIQSRLSGAKRLFVVPDGSIHLVSLASLPEGPAYWVETGPLVQYLSAERDLVRLPRRGEATGLLALGGAAFDAPEEEAAGGSASPDDSVESESTIPARHSVPRGVHRSLGPKPECEEFRNTRFRALPETAREVQEIAALWGDSSRVVLLTGARAGETSLKALAPGRRVLHLATHGFFLDATQCAADERPGVRGIGGVTTERPARSRAASLRTGSPLLLSGLALAGANLRLSARPDQEDGILMAQEVASLDLSNTEWVVLSACDTGLGKLQAGEGVLGLRRAFEAAGAGAVIMSLWEVEDRSSREWMRHLYESRFRLGRPTPEAVRDADLAVLRDRRAQGLGTHPFHWAGFVAAGDWK